MKKLSNIFQNHYSPYSETSVIWKTSSGTEIKVVDEGVCYTVFVNGKFSGAIDSNDDLDLFAKTNHFAEFGGCKVRVITIA